MAVRRSEGGGSRPGGTVQPYPGTVPVERGAGVLRKRGVIKMLLTKRTFQNTAHPGST